jgi:hypothetical protein
MLLFKLPVISMWDLPILRNRGHETPRTFFDPMKYLLIAWTLIRSCFEASVWATAAWCVLFPFFRHGQPLPASGGWNSLLWLQCFGLSLAVQLAINHRIITFAFKHSANGCQQFIKVDSMFVGSAILLALISSVIPAIGGIVLLNLTIRWTHMPPNWLRTWLFVLCICYSYFRSKGKQVQTEEAERMVPVSTSLRSIRSFRTAGSKSQTRQD